MIDTLQQAADKYDSLGWQDVMELRLQAKRELEMSQQIIKGQQLMIENQRRTISQLGVRTDEGWG